MLKWQYKHKTMNKITAKRFGFKLEYSTNQGSATEDTRPNDHITINGKILKVGQTLEFTDNQFEMIITRKVSI